MLPYDLTTMSVHAHSLTVKAQGDVDQRAGKRHISKLWDRKPGGRGGQIQSLNLKRECEPQAASGSGHWDETGESYNIQTPETAILDVGRERHT